MIEMVINGIGDNQSPLISFIFTYRNNRLAKHFFNKNIYIHIATDVAATSRSSKS